MATRTGRWGWGVVALWVLGASTTTLLQSWLFEASFLISLAFLPLLVMLAIALFVVLLAVRAWKPALLFVAATVLIAVLPLNALGHKTWARISFSQHRAAYERIVALGPSLADRGTVEDHPYIKDGRRIAFPRAYGMPDGWSAVIHDPANTLTPVERPRSQAFGSSIRSCIRIEEDWYRCWLD